MEQIRSVLERIMTKKLGMTRVDCAWCKKTMGFKPIDVKDERLKGAPTSTICEDCLRKYFPKHAKEVIKESKQK